MRFSYRHECEYAAAAVTTARFVDREAELARERALCGSDQAALAIVYGRRRSLNRTTW
jgi:hypothetical protein